MYCPILVKNHVSFFMDRIWDQKYIVTSIFRIFQPTLHIIAIIV